MQIFGYQLKLQSRISARRKERRSTGGSLKLLNVCRRKTFLPVREKEFEEGSAVIADRPSLPPPFASLNTVVYLVGEIEIGKERTRQKEKKRKKGNELIGIFIENICSSTGLRMFRVQSDRYFLSLFLRD